MKKGKLFIKKVFITSILSLLLFSCASTDNENQNPEKSKNSPEAGIQEVKIAEPEVPVPTAEELFLQSIEDYSISFSNIPSKIKKGKAFGSAFEVVVVDSEGAPVTDFDICFNYPKEKSGSALVFSNEIIKTDENGKASLTLDVIKFAAQAKVTAKPAIPEGLNISDTELTSKTVTADFLVESDIATKGAIMFVFEYTESGKPSKNSYDILSGLRKKGVYLIGNAPISDTDYINASKQKIYKENYNIVGTDYGYLIGGTIKFASPVEQIENGYEATLLADIYGIDMKTGEVIYENTHEIKATGTNWNYAVSNCRDKLTQIVVDSIMFGL